MKTESIRRVAAHYGMGKLRLKKAILANEINSFIHDESTHDDQVDSLYYAFMRLKVPNKPWYRRLWGWTKVNILRIKP